MLFSMKLNHARRQSGFMYKTAAIPNSTMMYVTTKLTQKTCALMMTLLSSFSSVEDPQDPGGGDGTSLVQLLSSGGPQSKGFPS